MGSSLRTRTGGKMRGFIAFLLFLIGAAALAWVSGQQPAPSSPESVATPGLFRLVKGQLDAQSTESAANATARAVQATAFAAGQDANSYIARQTAIAFDATQQAGNRQATETAAAAQATASAEAVRAATATEQAWTIIRMTADASDAKNTAEAKRLATADALQQAAIERDARQTETAANHIATMLRQEEERQAAVNQVMAWAPYAGYTILMVAVVGVLVLAAIKYWRAPHQVKQNKNGQFPLLLDNLNNLIIPSRLPAGLVHLLATGGEAPRLADPDAQERTVSRDQAVMMATHGQAANLQRSRAETGEFPQAAPAPQPNFRIFGAEETPAPLAQDPETMRILEAQWKDENA